MKKRLTLAEAIDDFATHVEPHLFPEGRKKNKDYYRVKNLLYAKEAEAKGEKPNRRVTPEWAEKILTEFAPGRYRFEHHTDIFLESSGF